MISQNRSKPPAYMLASETDVENTVQKYIFK